MEWDDRYLVGHQAMDDTHREFATLVQRNAARRRRRTSRARSTRSCGMQRSTSRLEQRLMERYGFPPRDLPRRRARARAGVDARGSLARRGRRHRRRSPAGAGAGRLVPGHSDHMDSALATWVFKKVANGAPVVVAPRDAGHHGDHAWRRRAVGTWLGNVRDRRYAMPIAKTASDWRAVRARCAGLSSQGPGLPGRARDVHRARPVRPRDGTDLREVLDLRLPRERDPQPARLRDHAGRPPAHDHHARRQPEASTASSTLARIAARR